MSGPPSHHAATRPPPEAARDADRPAIAALHIASWRTTYHGILPDDLLGEPLEAEKTADWSRRPLEGRCIVLRDATGISGFAAFDPGHADGLLLDNLHVRPGLVGRGHGATLMQAVARGAGGRALWLEVLEGNVNSRAVYLRWGGREGDVFADPILGVMLPARRVTWPDAGVLADRLDRGFRR